LAVFHAPRVKKGLSCRFRGSILGAGGHRGRLAVLSCKGLETSPAGRNATSGERPLCCSPRQRSEVESHVGEHAGCLGVASTSRIEPREGLWTAPGLTRVWTASKSLDAVVAHTRLDAAERMPAPTAPWETGKRTPVSHTAHETTPPWAASSGSVSFA
jgi:hypothetical protein